jgi:hypothetical protein
VTSGVEGEGGGGSILLLMVHRHILPAGEGLSLALPLRFLSHQQTKQI